MTKKDWTRDILNAGSRAYRLTPAERNDIELVLKIKDAVVERLGLKRDRLFDEAELQRLLAECPITQTTPYPRYFIAALRHFIGFSSPPNQEQLATFRRKKQAALQRAAPSTTNAASTSTSTNAMKVFFGIVKAHKKLVVHIASFPDMKGVTVTGTGDDVLGPAVDVVTQWVHDHPTSVPADVPTLMQRKDVRDALAGGGYLLPVTPRKDLVDLPADPQEFFFTETAERFRAEARAYCVTEPEIYFIDFIIAERHQLAERSGIKHKRDGTWSKAELRQILAEGQRVWPDVLADDEGDDMNTRRALAERQGIDLLDLPRFHSANFMMALKLRLAMVEAMGWFDLGAPRAPETLM